MSLEERNTCRAWIDEAVVAGARKEKACEILGLDPRRLQRWERSPEDRRDGPKQPPKNRLSKEERAEVLAVANSPEYRDLSPKQIVPRLADQGRYLASESTFFRLLRSENMLAHRGRQKPVAHARPEELMAMRSNQVWSWDITFLKAPVIGEFFRLYMVEDIYSRYIVGWRLEEREDAEMAAELVEGLCLKYGIEKKQLHLHSDNGGPMKGATMLATLQRLGVMPSFSRPSVSDDNPYSESLFKTLKYRPSYPDGRFASIEEARAWVERFVQWYNFEHLHSGIGFVTPASRHFGEHEAILAQRREVYEQARAKNPERWSRNTRTWENEAVVYLNPRKEKSEKRKSVTNQNQTAS